MKLPGKLSVKFIAILVALMGLLNIVSSLFLYSPERLHLLHNILPPQVTQGTRGLNVAVGFLLIAVAWNLAGHKFIAYVITNWLLFFSAVSHITKGLDVEEALISLILILVLWSSRKEFYAKTDPDAIQQLLFSIPYAIIFFFLYGLAGFYFLREQFKPSFNLYSAVQETINLATFHGDVLYAPLTRHARWFTESITFITGVGVIYVLFSLTRPIHNLIPVRHRDRMIACDIVREFGLSGIAYFATTNDKRYFFNSHDACIIPYALIGNVAISAGDPIGPDNQIESTINEFLIFCKENSWIPAFYQVGEKYRDKYSMAWLRILKIGEEAIVDVRSFTTEGKSMQQIRQGINKGSREKWQFLTFEGPVDDEKILPQLKEIYDGWKSNQLMGEMGFTLGGAPVTGSDETMVVVATDADKKVLACGTLAPMYRGNGWAIDFMLRVQDAPNGIMEFLFASIIDYLKKENFKYFCLGMAPLSNVESEDPDAVLSLEKGINLIYEKFNTVYHFKSLRHFKEKFEPVWENRYLVYPTLIDIPKVAHALILAHMPNLKLTDLASSLGSGSSKKI